MENKKINELGKTLDQLKKQLQSIEKETKTLTKFIQTITRYIKFRDPLFFYLWTKSPAKIEKNKTLSVKEEGRLKGKKNI